MVDPTLGGRIDYQEVFENVDLESPFEGTRFEGDGNGVLGFVGGELGENLGRVLGALAGYVVGAVLIGSSILGGGEGADEGTGDADDAEEAEA